MAVGSSAIGNLAVLLSLDTAAFEQGSNRATRLMKQTQRQFHQMGSKISGIGKAMSIGITAPFVGLMAKAIPAATEARAAMAQVEQGLKTMGGASGKTAEELKKSARELQRLSTYDDDDILRKVTANLITFGNISGKEFDRAQKAVLDMATRLKMDLQPATIMVAKALNDPVKGLTAMGRAGIQFTEAQKDMIKAMVASGDAAGAQRMILAELEKQFGGSAKAARDAAPGSDTIDAWRDFNETIGEMALKVLPKLTNILTKVLDSFNNLSPGMQTTIVGFAAVAAAIGPVLMLTGSAISMFGTLLPTLIKLSGGFTAAGTAAGGTAVGVGALTAALGPLALAALAVYVAWKNWDKIKPHVDKLGVEMQAIRAKFQALDKDLASFNAWVARTDARIAEFAANAVASVRRLYEGVRTWMVDRLGAVWDNVKQKVEAVTGFFRDMAKAVVLNSYVPDMVDGIARHMARLEAEMVQPVKTATEKAAEHFRNLHNLLARLFPEIERAKQLTSDLGMIAGSGLSAEEQTEARRRLFLQSGALDNVVPIGDAIEEVKDEMPDLADIVHRTTADIVTSFADMARDVVASLGGMVRAFKSGDILGGITQMLDMVGQIVGMIGGNRTGATRVFTPGLNSGGLIRIGGLPGIDRNMLAINGAPVARVSRGEDIQVIPNRGGGAGRQTVIHMNGVITNDQFWGEIAARDNVSMMAGAAGGAGMVYHKAARRIP